MGENKTLSAAKSEKNDFGIAYSPCAVTLSGIYPSREFYDSPVHFVTNGARYKAHNYTVLGVGFESEPGASGNLELQLPLADLRMAGLTISAISANGRCHGVFR